jgi:hypothetical protein
MTRFSDQGKTKILYVPSNSRFEQWYRASLRRDLRELGMLDGEETDEEREILESYESPSADNP